MSFPIYRINHQKILEPDISEWFINAFFNSITEEFKNSTISNHKKVNPDQKNTIIPNIRHTISNPHLACLYFAFDEEKPIGYFLGIIKSYLAEIPSRVGYVNGLYVEPNYRRKKVASLLWEQGKKWFDKKGLEIIELYVAHGNDAAKSFWSKNGYSGFEEVMFTSLKSPSINN